MLRSCSSRRGWPACGLLVALLLSPAFSVADDAALTADAALKLWNEAETQIDRTQARLQEIQAAFQKAKPAEQAKLREEAYALVDEFQASFRKITQAAPLAYKGKAAAEESKQKALQLVQQAMLMNYSQNRYLDAAQLAETVLAVDEADPLALNIGGASHFATNNFERAVALLDRAEKEQTIIPAVGDIQIAGNDPAMARKYVEYWKKELAIREQEAAAEGDAALPRVKLTTTKGHVVIELFENEAPNTVASYISLIEKGYYNGSDFHRVIPTFMAQGGMPGEGFGGTTGPGYTIKCECYQPNARRHFGGSLSMAHAGKDTGGGQFFLTHLPTPHLDREIRPESVHTVFGRVIEGMDVVWSLEQGDEIKQATVLRKRGHEYTPVTQPGR
ncbi:MAG: peptidylprolyl isomerase [Planctomycetaceae bacterium]